MEQQTGDPRELGPSEPGGDRKSGVGRTDRQMPVAAHGRTRRGCDYRGWALVQYRKDSQVICTSNASWAAKHMAPCHGL